MTTGTAEVTQEVSHVTVRPPRAGEWEVVAAWLGDERNARWLDFGAGVERLDALKLKLMAQRGHHEVRVFCRAHEDDPVGLVGLGNINRRFGTAEAWCLLGRKEYGSQDLTVQATAWLLAYAFHELGLASVYAWTVECNRGGRRLLERTGFRCFGRQRRCHVIDGRVYDRIWFDLLAEEFQGYRMEWRHSRQKP